MLCVCDCHCLNIVDVNCTSSSAPNDLNILNTITFITITHAGRIFEQPLNTPTTTSGAVGMRVCFGVRTSPAQSNSKQRELACLR